MTPTTYDLVVIGAGPAGQSAAELAAFLGHSALIIERQSPGGVVTTTGGAPTKTLREIALSLKGDSKLAEVLPLLRTRTIGVCRSLQTIVAQQIEARGISYLQGSARIDCGLNSLQEQSSGSLQEQSAGKPEQSSGTVRRRVVVTLADGSQREITARTIVLATGSTPTRHEGIPFDDPDVYDSNQIFSMTRTPDDIVIAGAGPVGVEFATVFTALGVPVTLVDRASRLLPSMDAELTQVMRAEFERLGVRLLLDEGVQFVRRHAARLVVGLSSGVQIDADAVLFAAGRTANTKGLGLEDAGVALDARGRVVVDRYYQTTTAGIYAVGDAVGPTLASLAMQQGRAAVCHALGLSFGVPVDRAASAAVYGMPEIAGVGATEEDAQRAGAAYVVGRCELSQTARGAIAGRGGRLKLVVSADDRTLLGVHCIGDIASELVAMGHAVIHMGGAIDVFLTLALNTPTYCAAYRDAAIDALKQLAALARRPIQTASTLQSAGEVR